MLCIVGQLLRLMSMIIITTTAPPTPIPMIEIINGSIPGDWFVEVVVVDELVVGDVVADVVVVEVVSEEV